MPIYVVTDKSNGQVRLVKAATKAAAIKFASRPFVAEIPTAEELVELTLAGIKVESATEEETDHPGRPDETKAGAEV